MSPESASVEVEDYKSENEKKSGGVMLDNGLGRLPMTRKMTYIYDCWRVLATGVPDLHNMKPSKYG